MNDSRAQKFQSPSSLMKPSIMAQGLRYDLVTNPEVAPKCLLDLRNAKRANDPSFRLSSLKEAYEKMDKKTEGSVLTGAIEEYIDGRREAGLENITELGKLLTLNVKRGKKFC